MRNLIALISGLFVTCIAFLAAGNAQVAPSQNLECPWSAELTAARPDFSDSYKVPFELLIERTPKGLAASLINGSDRIEFSSIVQQGGEVTMRLEQYDATLSAHCLDGCASLAGEYVRQKGSSVARYGFSAKCERPQKDSGSQSKTAESTSTTSIASDWQFTFTDPSGKAEEEPTAPGSFRQTGERVEGTIAPISGDYGLLAGGIVEGNRSEAARSEGKNAEIHLSRFDGIHALRLDGRFVTPDRMEGVFHTSPGTALSFVAVRASRSAAGFGEAEQLTSVTDPAEPFRFHGVDASGTVVTQNDPRFRGKVVLVDIFGSWCPNCHDEAPMLQSLYSKFHARGFEVVGLSYEYVDDRVRNLHLIDVYRRKYSIEFPLLLAGTTEKGQIAATLPQLRNFGAYPTTIFLDRHGRVRLIHAGFSGPATGRLEEIKQSFEQSIMKLIDEP